jgi:1-acyl-sn-glycerol-3-phosphate acyltransferase
MLRLIRIHAITLLFRLISKAWIKLTIVGRENVPSAGPLIIISNHFSWFEPPLLGIHLPNRPSFFAAAELAEQSRLLKYIFSPFDVIAVRRGRVDRAALWAALQRLEQGGHLLIFPEGGIDPDLQEAVASGRSIPLDEGQNARLSAQLIPARPGAAFLAVKSQVRILPVAFLGTEQVLNNMRHWRRTPVTMRIGVPFGPLPMEPGLRGAARRAYLDEMGHAMMRQVAALLPVENRGPYA